MALMHLLRGSRPDHLEIRADRCRRRPEKIPSAILRPVDAWILFEPANHQVSTKVQIFSEV